jgi:hypothetical protein
MTQIIRLKKATGVQLQQAAHHARVIDTPNQVYGLANAYYASTPSPMQEQILRKALQAIGCNYLKVTEVCVPAEAQDLFPVEVKKALRTLMQELVRHGASTEHTIGAAGKILYAKVPTKDPKTAVKLCGATVKGRGFQRTEQTWVKSVRVHRKSYCAVVEVGPLGVEVSVFKGA